MKNTATIDAAARFVGFAQATGATLAVIGGTDTPAPPPRFTATRLSPTSDYDLTTGCSTYVIPLGQETAAAALCEIRAQSFEAEQETARRIAAALSAPALSPCELGTVLTALEEYRDTLLCERASTAADCPTCAAHLEETGALLTRLRAYVPADDEDEGAHGEKGGNLSY